MFLICCINDDGTKEFLGDALLNLITRFETREKAQEYLNELGITENQKAEIFIVDEGNNAITQWR